MDDLASELRLRRLEPPYRAVEKELADRFIQADRLLGACATQAVRAIRA
jgi:hypothetical protein